MLTGGQQGERQTQRHMPAIWRIGKPSSLGSLGWGEPAQTPGLARQTQKQGDEKGNGNY